MMVFDLKLGNNPTPAPYRDPILKFMKAEKVILSFVAILIGLFVAGIAFYFYQSTKIIPEIDKKVISTKFAPTTQPSSDTSFITLNEPEDEQIVGKRSVTIKGKTTNDATIIVSSEDTDQVAKPASDGSFALTHTIGTDTTVLEITAVFQDGSEKTIKRTVTFSTEDF